MNGAQSLVQTLVNCGIDTCFANPGTSEMHLVAALDTVKGLRPVLCLFEGVATGAADGYGRIAGKPAATLLHLGPGLANGLANLHNARRAATPIVNVVGDHATYHLQYDALLTSDIAGFARPVSGWIHETKSARLAAGDAARAVQAARAAPGGIATLILSADAAWNPAERAAHRLPDIGPAIVTADAIEDIARLMSNGKKTAMLLRGRALVGDGLEAAGRIQAKTGVRLLCDTFAPHAEMGAGRVPVERIPYFGEQVAAFLAGTEQLVMVGSTPPVSFFAYPNKPSWCVPEACELIYLAQPHEDGVRALQNLADALGAPREISARVPLHLPGLPTGLLNSLSIAQIIAQLTPDHAIYADESNTCQPAAADDAGARASAYAFAAGRRLHRAGAAACRRRGAGRSRSQGGLSAWRRRRRLYHAGAVDHGARKARRDHGHLRQPVLCDPQLRTVSGGRDDGRRQRALDARPAQSGDELDADRERFGRRSEPRHHGRGIRRAI